MHERLLDKNKKPMIEFLEDYIGSQSYNNLLQFEGFLNKNYQLSKEMKFPFGNNYGRDINTGILPTFSSKTVDLWKTVILVVNKVVGYI